MILGYWQRNSFVLALGMCDLGVWIPVSTLERPADQYSYQSIWDLFIYYFIIMTYCFIYLLFYLFFEFVYCTGYNTQKQSSWQNNCSSTTAAKERTVYWILHLLKLVMMQKISYSSDATNPCSALLAVVTGTCKIYEEYLKKMNPNSPSITYDISQLFDFIDSLADLSCLV